MKNLLFTALAILLVTDFAIAQYDEGANDIFNINNKVLERAPANYLRGLQKDNYGVVESAMINLMKLRTVYPDGDYEEISSELERLQQEGKTKSIRVMAYITANYLKSPDRFTWLDQNDLTVMDSTLATLSQQLKSKAD